MDLTGGGCALCRGGAALGKLSAVAVVLVLAAALVLAAVPPSHVRAMDAECLRGAQTLRSPALTVVGLALTALGEGAFLTLVVLGGSLVLRRSGSGEVALLLSSGILAAAVTHAIKFAVARPRPQLVERVVEAAGYAFPSGHTFGAAAVYLALAVGLGRRCLRWRIQLVALAWLVVIGVGASRVYLGVHYPTDVIAGWLLGAATVTLLQRHLIRRQGPRVQPGVSDEDDEGAVVRR
ncbi:phosphatase PAP2 family protein [Myxococcota bacterium]